MRYLRFPDLVARGIVRNRQTLANWINKYGFPAGVKVGNTRAFPEDEVNAWLAERAA